MGRALIEVNVVLVVEGTLASELGRRVLEEVEEEEEEGKGRTEILATGELVVEESEGTGSVAVLALLKLRVEQDEFKTACTCYSRCTRRRSRRGL